MRKVKTPYQKYKDAEQRLWQKFKVTVRDVCNHPSEYVTSKSVCDEDEYGRTNYNSCTTNYKCAWCGATWHVEE